jgi:hypothetical protein
LDGGPRLYCRNCVFACARLSQPCLSESCPDFSATFTTVAFDNSSLRWLEINTCCRPRRTFLHLSYSYAAPFGPAILVTQDPTRTLAAPGYSAVIYLPLSHAAVHNKQRAPTHIGSRGSSLLSYVVSLRATCPQPMEFVFDNDRPYIIWCLENTTQKSHKPTCHISESSNSPKQKVCPLDINGFCRQ